MRLMMIRKAVSSVYILFTYLHICIAAECPPHASYSSCGGACPKSCQTINKEVPCTMQCVPGCFCDAGYVLNEAGSCVLPEECNATKAKIMSCREDEEPIPCGGNCEPTCAEPNKTCNPNECTPGCGCKNGTIRGRPGEFCVDRNSCPTINSYNQTCPEHNWLTTCVDPCGPNCEHRVRLPCYFLVCWPGCICQPGYFRNNSGICVPEDECPKSNPCGENEEYRQCGPSCPDTCENWAQSSKPCTDECVVGCFCANDTVRDNATNKCVEKEQCSSPPKCGTNEILRRSGTECDCGSCYPISSPRCACKDGYVRNAIGACVVKAECNFDNKCKSYDSNSEYSACVGCIRTCNSLLGPFVCPKTAKCRAGCRCKSGYILNSFGRCVPSWTCFVYTSPLFDPSNYGIESSDNVSSEVETSVQTRSKSKEIRPNLETMSLFQRALRQYENIRHNKNHRKLHNHHGNGEVHRHNVQHKHHHINKHHQQNKHEKNHDAHKKNKHHNIRSYENKHNNKHQNKIHS